MRQLNMFTYGTLRYRFVNHYMVEDYPFLGTAVIPGLVMHERAFPIVTPAIDSTQTVYGEIYRIEESDPYIQAMIRMESKFGYVPREVKTKYGSTIIWIWQYPPSMFDGQLSKNGIFKGRTREEIEAIIAERQARRR